MAMKVYVKNRPKNRSLNEIRSLIKFMGEKLKIDNYSVPTVVVIKFINDMQKTSGCLANCTWTDDNHLPREFEIEVDYKDKWPKKTLDRALIHEMIHVTQFAKGKMKDMMAPPWYIKWEGKMVPAFKMDYYDHPWEIEAYGREQGFSHKWRDHNKKLRKRKTIT